jgi:hypothetical protein
VRTLAALILAVRDAASVKQNRSAPNANGGGIRPGGAISMRNITVRMLVEGDPAWNRWL